MVQKAKVESISEDMPQEEGNLKPAYIVRYADDWVVVTDTLEHAQKYKFRITEYLKNNLKIELSQDKTKITNIRKKAIKFLRI